MHIHISNPSLWERQWGLWPHHVYSALFHTKTQIFRWGLVGDGVEGSSSTPECPWIGQTGSGPAKPRPHSDSHEFPQFHWPVGWLLIQQCATVLPLNAVMKGREGGSRSEIGDERKIIIFPLLSQHDPDNSRLPFSVGTKLPLCPKSRGRKEKQKAKRKGGASKVNPLQARSERPSFKEQKKIYLLSLSLLSLLCLAIKSGFYVHLNGRGSQNMHANEREPRGTNISLQTYMHMESRREREGEKERPGERSKDEREGKKKDAEKTETGGLKDGCWGRETVWKKGFNGKIRAEGRRQACCHHDGSHLRMLLQAWRLWLW